MSSPLLLHSARYAERADHLIMLFSPQMLARDRTLGLVLTDMLDQKFGHRVSNHDPAISPEVKTTTTSKEAAVSLHFHEHLSDRAQTSFSSCHSMNVRVTAATTAVGRPAEYRSKSLRAFLSHVPTPTIGRKNVMANRRCVSVNALNSLFSPSDILAMPVY